MSERFDLRAVHQLRAAFRAHLATPDLHTSGLIYNVALVPVTDLKGTTFTATYLGTAVELVEATCLVFLRGRPLRPGVDFTVSGSVFTFAEAPLRADETAAVSDPGDEPWIFFGRLAA